MNPTIQPGMHPDAESLSAFAEQSLPAAEREQILAHMATCGRCREVVFLVQKAGGEDEPEIAPVPTREPGGAGRSWLAKWRWTWVPVAALAGLAGVAVVQHFHHGAQPEPQMNARLAPTDALAKAELAPAAPVSSPSTEPVQPAKEKTLASPRKIIPREMQKDAAKQFDEKTPSETRDEGFVGGSAGAATGVMGGLGGGSAHGAMTARAKSQSLGGPMANQFQQNANQLQQQNFVQQNAAQPSRNAPALSADKPVSANAAPGAATQTVTVQTEPVQTAPAPAPPMTLSLAENEAVEVNGGQVADLKKAKIALPGGAGVLSSASASGRMIALDTAGALFVRENNQKHWQPVPAQWTGRAVLVRTRLMPGSAQSAPVLAIVQNPRFELVTDKLQTWVSVDGKTWTAEPMPGK